MSPWPRFRADSAEFRRFPFEDLCDEGRRELAQLILGSYQDSRSPEFRSLGFRNDQPDGRDFDLKKFLDRSTDAQKTEFKRKLTWDTRKPGMRERLHLADHIPQRKKRNFFGLVQDQGMYNSCTAHAVTDMMEFHYRRSLSGDDDANVEFSRLFAYKMGRSILGWDGDDGCQIRAVIKAILYWGVPFEEHWPYVDGLLHQYPSPDVLARAKNYNGRLGKMAYYRVGRPAFEESRQSNTNSSATVELRALLACGLPVACGIYLSRSASLMDDRFIIPVPDLSTDRWLGGHAVLIVGYDERVPYTVPGETQTRKGAFIVRNSWGEGWGDGGYAFLPYSFVDLGYAVDLWVARPEP